jgi:uncharacterized protein (DUF2236 family)
MRTVFNPARPPVLPIPDGVWSLIAAPGNQLLKLVTIGTLPGPFRARLGLRWTRDRELALRAQQEAIRRVFPRLPDRLRLMPPALAARRGETLAVAA